MDSNSKNTTAPKSEDSRTKSTTTPPVPLSVGHGAFQAYVKAEAEASQAEYKKSTENLRAFGRALDERTAAIELATPGAKRGVASSTSLASPARRTKTTSATTHRSPPRFTSPTLVAYGDGPYPIEPKDGLVMPLYKVVTCGRTDSAATFVYKGVRLKNEPLLQSQIKTPKDAQTLECAFFRKLDPESDPCLDWRRKLGMWLAKCLGKAGSDNYILGAFPEGYALWEYVHGHWVLPYDPDTPVDPTKLIIVDGKLFTESQLQPVDDDAAQPNKNAHAKTVARQKIKTDIRFDMMANGDGGTHGPNTPAPETGTVFATAGQMTALPDLDQALWSQRRGDLYLYGYKDNKRYAAPNEFFAHLLWLAMARTSNDGTRQMEFACTCKHCDRALEVQRQEKKGDRIGWAFSLWKKATQKVTIAK